MECRLDTETFTVDGVVSAQLNIMVGGGMAEVGDPTQPCLMEQEERHLEDGAPPEEEEWVHPGASVLCPTKKLLYFFVFKNVI